MIGSRKQNINHHNEDCDLDQIQSFVVGKRVASCEKLGEPLLHWSFRINRHTFCSVENEWTDKE